MVAIGNGTRGPAEALREELKNLLEEELKLKLSEDKTKITPINDGFNFLGFKITRGRGQKGMTTKVYVPREAVDRLRVKISAATDSGTHQDSVNSKILALNRIIKGWCRYYPYTRKASTTFNGVGQEIFGKVAHGLGRKFQIPMTEVMRRFKDHQNGSLRIGAYRLVKATEFPTKAWGKRYIKPNPYTAQEIIAREELPSETYWTGYEPRPVRSRQGTKFPFDANAYIARTQVSGGCETIGGALSCKVYLLTLPNGRPAPHRKAER